MRCWGFDIKGGAARAIKTVSQFISKGLGVAAARSLCVLFVGLLLAPQSGVAGDFIKLTPHDNVVNKEDKVCFDAQKLHNSFERDLGHYTGSIYRRHLRSFETEAPSKEKTMLRNFVNNELQPAYDRNRHENDPMTRFLSGMLDSEKPERLWTHFTAYYMHKTDKKYGGAIAQPMVYGHPHPVVPKLTSVAAADICAEFIAVLVNVRGFTSKGGDSPCNRKYRFEDNDAGFYDDNADDYSGPDVLILRPMGRTASLLPNGKSNFGFSKKAFAMRRPACASRDDAKQKAAAKRQCKASLVSCSGDKKQGDIPTLRLNNSGQLLIEDPDSTNEVKRIFGIE